MEKDLDYKKYYQKLIDENRLMNEQVCREYINEVTRKFADKIKGMDYLIMGDDSVTFECKVDKFICMPMQQDSEFVKQVSLNLIDMFGFSTVIVSTIKFDKTVTAYVQP